MKPTKTELLLSNPSSLSLGQQISLLPELRFEVLVILAEILLTAAGSKRDEAREPDDEAS